MGQLIDLILAMPPIGSAIVSLMACGILWFGGKALLEPVMKQLAAQSVELQSQSKDLVAIKVQTTKTNGKVEAMDRTLSAHEDLDETRHVETTARLDRNQNGIHTIRDQVSEFALKVIVQARRINKRDDALGVSSEPPPDVKKGDDANG